MFGGVFLNKQINNSNHVCNIQIASLISAGVWEDRIGHITAFVTPVVGTGWNEK